MQGLIDNLLDLARGRLGGGLTLNRNANAPLEPVLREVIRNCALAIQIELWKRRSPD